MSKQPSNFRETDVKRVVRAIQSAGLKKWRIELPGKIIISSAAAESEPPANEWAIDE